jgi:hypothetical protein
MSWSRSDQWRLDTIARQEFFELTRGLLVEVKMGLKGRSVWGIIPVKVIWRCDARRQPIPGRRRAATAL